MEQVFKATMASILIGLFGLFLLWKGIAGDVVRTQDGRALFPRWMYIFSGAFVLILPVTYLILNLMM